MMGVGRFLTTMLVLVSRNVLELCILVAPVMLLPAA